MFGLIYQLISDHVPIFGIVGIISAIFTQEVPTIGIYQTIICNAKTGTEKNSHADLGKNVP